MNVALDSSQAAVAPEELEDDIARESKALLARQHEDGH